MTDSNIPTTNELEPGYCISYRLRRAARLAAKSYDNALRPSGLRNTQFTLLTSLSGGDGISIGDLSETLAIDGTTLTRNLEVLVRRGLIENIAGDDARVRNVRLTDAGKAAFEAALPLWREAQHNLLEAIKPERWTEMATKLGKIEIACSHP
jgi:DNA-binding MarR family transcriptional regulator